MRNPRITSAPSLAHFLGISGETGNKAGIGAKCAVLLGNLRVLAGRAEQVGLDGMDRMLTAENAEIAKKDSCPCHSQRGTRTVVAAPHATKSGPWKLVWSDGHRTRSEAARRERQIKQMKSARWIPRRVGINRLVVGSNPTSGASFYGPIRSCHCWEVVLFIFFVPRFFRARVPLDIAQILWSV